MSLADAGIILGIVLGALALVFGGIVLIVLVERSRRPRLLVGDIWFEQDTIARGFKRWHIKVENERNRGFMSWVDRNTASGVEATIEFFDNGTAWVGPQIHGIWSEQPRPLSDDLTVQAHRATLVPGRPWNMLVAFKYKGQKSAHQWDERNYQANGSFAPVAGRSLAEGDYAVRVTIFEGGSVHPFWFHLKNRTDELSAFELLGPFKNNPIQKEDEPLLPEHP